MAVSPRPSQTAPARRPRQRVSVGGSQVNAGDLRGLQAAWRERSLVLFLGAGVSAQWGVPNWRTLVLDLLFEQTEEARRLRDLWPHYRRALGEWLAEHFDYDPVILARVVKNDIRRRAARHGAPPDVAQQRFLDMVRRHLYAGYGRVSPRQPGAPTTLDAVAALLQRAAPQGNVAAVVTFNFDDLLEQALTQRGVPHHVVHDDTRRRDEGLPIVHPHGFLPRAGEPSESLVFTEDDYHRLTESTFHWALTRIVTHLREQTVLFLGLSMSDPSLRRLLDAGHRRGDRPAHWQVQRRHAVRDEERPLVIQRVQDLARRYGGAFGADALKSPPQLKEAVDAVLSQADTYDRELFEAMGVKTIWLEEYGDVPPLLAHVVT